MTNVRSLALAGLTVVLGPTAICAQSTVAVVDEAGRPIPFAVVQHRGAYARIANDSGRAILTAPKRDSVQLDVRRLGFQPFYGWAKPRADGAYLVTLKGHAQVLDAAEVEAFANTPLARTGFYDRVERARRGAFTAEFITPEELEARNAMDISRMLDGRRGVTVSRNKANGHPLILGRGGCGMNIVLDGQLIYTAEQGVSSMHQELSGAGRIRQPGPHITELVGGNEVMAIEIYMSLANAPAELVPLGGRGSCGIVAIWTGGRR